MLIAVLASFIIAMLLPLSGKFLFTRYNRAMALLPLSLFVYLLTLLPGIANGNPYMVTYEWVPTAGINFSFLVDGLSLLFALMITGIGSLVFLYSAAYLEGDPRIKKFYSYLCLFMGAMLGMVLSDNIFTLFIFWELTSISSFFLIGFNNREKASRKSALMALGITGLGGFFLLAGLALISSINGSFLISDMLLSPGLFKEHRYYELIIACIFLAAFTKSAQFPFHFWLPAAMKAPTPVSTYLHSATMVKAGIYLLARFTPVLGNDPYWNNTLLMVGGFTMAFAAFHSIFKKDLKVILAYSTVSALGMLVFLLGMGGENALMAMAVFIIVHALYKAALFLVAGIIDHETGTRNIIQLGGLRKLMMPVAIAGLLAVISNAGIPPSVGFVGKEMIYEAGHSSETFGWLLTVVAIVTNIFLLYAGMLAGVKPFAGPLPAALQKAHMPGWEMWVPPLLLGAAGLVFGLFPAIIETGIVAPATAAMTLQPTGIHLALWHGFNMVLAMSVATIALGILLYILFKPHPRHNVWLKQWEHLSAKRLLTGTSNRFRLVAKKWTSTLQNGYLRLYVLTIISFLVALLAYRTFTQVVFYVDMGKFTPISASSLVVMLIMVVSLLFIIITSSRLSAILAMGVIGYCICLIFMFYSAPDLAMTQFTIDTLTVILFVLVIYRLPKYIQYTDWLIRIRDGAVALVFGSLMTLLSLEVLNEYTVKDTSRYFAQNAYQLAKGKNIVNVILVDFRGMDTMIEIVVLSIAAMGVFTLLKLQLNKYDQEV